MCAPGALADLTIQRLKYPGVVTPTQFYIAHREVDYFTLGIRKHPIVRSVFNVRKTLLAFSDGSRLAHLAAAVESHEPSLLHELVGYYDADKSDVVHAFSCY